MEKARHSICVLATMAIIIAALSHIFTIGYGTGFESRGKAMLAQQQAKHYTPSLLTVHYKRLNGTTEDILRLEIDTTYRAIGKGQFVYKTICDRTISLQSSTGEQFTDDEARLCFVEGATREWVKLEDSRSIDGYDCLAAVAAADNGTWQAWYTTALPYCPDGTTATDGLNGLILMLRHSQGRYRLQATTIDLNIG